MVRAGVLALGGGVEGAGSAPLREEMALGNPTTACP